MKTLLVIVSLFFMLFSAVILAKPSTIVLIRHAEKQLGVDPVLTAQGQKRANTWLKILESYQVEQFFSTQYKRTIATITPMVTALQKEIQYYNPTQLLEFKTQLLQLNGAVLVVGHSNTTPKLAGLLSDTEQQEWPETNYNTYYVLTLIDGEYSIALKHLDLE